MHKCICDYGEYRSEFDILIDGDTVKLGPKIFNTEEIDRLKE